MPLIDRHCFSIPHDPVQKLNGFLLSPDVASGPQKVDEDGEGKHRQSYWNCRVDDGGEGS